MMVVTPIVGRTYRRPVAAPGGQLRRHLRGGQHLDDEPLHPGHLREGIVVALLVQGLGFSCLFVPLATTALSRIPRHKLADAAGLNSVVRFIGGSIGLAIFATLLTRHMTTVRSVLGTHVVAGSPTLLTRLYGAQRMFEQMGMNASAAHAGAGARGGRGGGAAVRGDSFETGFLLTGLSFLCVLPLVYPEARASAGPSDAARSPVPRGECNMKESPSPRIVRRNAPAAEPALPARAINGGPFVVSGPWCSGTVLARCGRVTIATAARRKHRRRADHVRRGPGGHARGGTNRRGSHRGKPDREKKGDLLAEIDASDYAARCARPRPSCTSARRKPNQPTRSAGGRAQLARWVRQCASRGQRFVSRGEQCLGPGGGSPRRCGARRG